MKNFLKEHGLWVLFAAAVIAVALACMSFFSANSAPLTNLAGIIASPFRAAYTAVADWISDKQKYYEDYTALEEENAALKQQIAEMEEAVRRSEKLEEENANYRDLLNLQQAHRDLTSDMESAYVIEHEVTNWTSSLTLNKGTANGVEVGDCVMDATGALVGLVDKAGYNWCRVLTTVDTDTSIGAQVFRTKDLGLAEGDFALMRQGRLRLGVLPADCQLLAGDLVETSGLGEYLPSGLVIGTVEEVQVDDSGATSYAVLVPKVDFDSLNQVFIIKSFDIVP